MTKVEPQILEIKVDGWQGTAWRSRASAFLTASAVQLRDKERLPHLKLLRLF